MEINENFLVQCFNQLKSKCQLCRFLRISINSNALKVSQLGICFNGKNLRMKFKQMITYEKTTVLFEVISTRQCYNSLGKNAY